MCLDVNQLESAISIICKNVVEKLVNGTNMKSCISIVCKF